MERCPDCGSILERLEVYSDPVYRCTNRSCRAEYDGSYLESIQEEDDEDIIL
jgi:DNA-directed RNA polymerase subunit RPC12/RpoP